MSRAVKIVLAANLAVLAFLSFIYPHLMVGPGKLIPGHRHLDGDCFACHAAFTGAQSQRCVVCHKPADIGRLTTAGQVLTQSLTSTPFHQKLISEDCVACHSDHAGVKRFHPQGSFNHTLLRAETREQCRDCHKPPADFMHRQSTTACTACHELERWKPAIFDHAKLAKDSLAQCQNCHRAPSDPLHREVDGNCGQCHGLKKWTPATFDHRKYFDLDRDHNASCVTCHPRNDWTRYTCYGCHEHSVESIRREHIKEGIRDYARCTECHRNANKHDIRGKHGDGDGEGRQKDRKDRKDKHRRDDES